jgi:5-methylcytosine-specific restriction endonuclease McrA
MPYKNPAKRRRRYRERRLNDPQWVARYRAYQREYQKKWLRAHPAKREHHRELVKRWRKKHPRKFRASRRAWRKNNPEKVRQMHQRWYVKHGRKWRERNRIKLRERAKRQYRKERRFKMEQQRARRHRYYWKNRERINKKRKTQWAKNPVPFRVRERERYRKHRLARIVSQRNIQARRAGAKGQITPEQWRRLLRRHHFLCFYCGEKLVPANRTLDHKIPLSRGGANTIDNVVPACRPCNQRKMRLTAREFLAEQKRGPRNFQ